MIQNKYFIGQKVKDGAIFRIEHPIFYCIATAQERKIPINTVLELFSAWNKIDELWFQKPLYCIQFKNPVAVLSREEFLEAYPYINKEPELFEIAYNQMVEKRYTLMLPEAAVVLDEKEENEVDNSGQQKVQQLFDFDRESA